MLKAAVRGVKVYLLIDAFGSANLPEEITTQLKDAGAEVKRYGPFYKSGAFHFGRRLHRKVIVFDRKLAIVAGLNISNNYNELGNKKSWLDFAVIVEGNIVSKLYSICLQRWVKKPLRTLPLKKDLKEKKSLSSFIHVRQNDMIRGLNEANATYRREIKNAKQSLFIVGGYFLPGGRVRRMLKTAFCTLNLVLGSFILLESRQPGATSSVARPKLAQWRHTLSNPVLALLILLFFLATFCFTCFETTLPLLLGSSKIHPHNLKDSQALLKTLKESSDPVSEHIRGLMRGNPTPLPTDPSQQDQLLEFLNRAVEQPGFRDPKVFPSLSTESGIPVSGATPGILRAALVHSNHLLLERSFPGLISAITLLSGDHCNWYGYPENTSRDKS